MPEKSLENPGVLMGLLSSVAKDQAGPQIRELSPLIMIRCLKVGFVSIVP